MIDCTNDRLDCTALCYFDKRITHREFRQRIAVCAGALAAHGVKKGDIVSVCILTMPETLVLLYAINYIGAVCNFLVLNDTEQEMHDKLVLTKSRLLFTVDLAAEKVTKATEGSDVKEIVCIPLASSMPPMVAIGARLKNKIIVPDGLIRYKEFLKDGKGITPSVALVDSHDMAVLEYTSGTTGKSKGVMLSNQAINTVSFHYKNSSTVFVFQPGEKFLCIVPPFLSIGLVTTLLMPLCVGFELILIPNSDPTQTASNLRKYRPNHFCGGPLHVNNIINDPVIDSMDLSFLSTVAYGGEKCDTNWEQKVSEFFYSHGMKHMLVNGYGLTETAASFCTSTHKTDFMIPFFKNNVMIRDVDTDEALPFEKEGEICVSGPSVMQGYYKRQEATNELMFEQDGIHWMRTGDLGMVTADGAFRVTGRLKRIFWVRAEDNNIYRIYPMAIEEVICRCPGVAHCGVVGMKNQEKGYMPVAFVVPENQGIDQNELQQEIITLTKQELNSVSQPYAIYFLENLPTTRADKVDFQKLEEMVMKEVLEDK